MNKHCLVICAKRYNGHELWTLLGVLKRRNHTFEVVSQEKIIRDELTLRPNTIERTVYEVSSDEVDNFDAIIVVSGNMADTEAYWDDKRVQSLLATFRENDKLIAAICCSVPTLSGVVSGVTVSFFPLVRSRARLEKGGAILSDVSLSVDGNTITAENQMMTQMWANEISNRLEGKDVQYEFHSSGFVPAGRPRRMPPAVREAIEQAKADREKAS